MIPEDPDLNNLPTQALTNPNSRFNRIYRAFRLPRFTTLRICYVDPYRYTAWVGPDDPTLATLYEEILYIRHNFGNHQCTHITISM